MSEPVYTIPPYHYPTHQYGATPAEDPTTLWGLLLEGLGYFVFRSM